MTKNTKKISLVDFPEEVDEKNHVKIYGETSYENQIAVLSHYIHNNREVESKEHKIEIISAIREFISRKQFRQNIISEEMTDEDIWNVAESSLQYGLFDDLCGKFPCQAFSLVA